MPSADKYSFTTFDGVTVYILDVPTKEQLGRDQRLGKFCANLNLNEHNSKCVLMRDIFETFTPYEVKCVTKVEANTPKEFEAYWEEELSPKGKGNLIVIYYDGLASGNGEDYEWNFKYMKKRVDAYEFIGTLCGSGVDALLILDCFLPTRFHDKWKHPKGSIEFIARGAPMQDHTGKVVAAEGEFTRAVSMALAGFHEGIKTTYNGYVAPRTIPEIMQLDKEIDSNPLRLWQDKTAAGSNKLIKRIKVRPLAIRETGKIEFFSFTIQQPKNTLTPETETWTAVPAVADGAGAVAAAPPLEVEESAHKDNGAMDDEDIGDEGIHDMGGPSEDDGEKTNNADE